MIGLVLALIVIAIVFTLVGLWIFAIPIGVVALILYVLFVLGWGRRTPTRSPDTPV